jgi:hypothetical protein
MLKQLQEAIKGRFDKVSFNVSEEIFKKIYDELKATPYGSFLQPYSKCKSLGITCGGAYLRYIVKSKYTDADILECFFPDFKRQEQRGFLGWVGADGIVRPEYDSKYDFC